MLYNLVISAYSIIVNCVACEQIELALAEIVY